MQSKTPNDLMPSERVQSTILRRSKKIDTKTASSRDAAVLALIDPQQRILICRRADHLKSFPGEACLAGGKCDKDDVSKVETALRETEEELSIDRSLVTVQYTLPPYRSLALITIHVIVGTVTEEPKLSINKDEVADAKWINLESFLKNEKHWIVQQECVDLHGFDFPDFAEVFGLTADLCMLIAIKELGKAPQFDINKELTVERMAGMTPSDIIEKMYENFDANARRLATRRGEVAKL